MKGRKGKRGQRYADISELPLSPCVWEMVAAIRQCQGSLGEPTLHLANGQLQIQSNGAMKYERGNRPAQEASYNPILTLNDPWY